MSQSSNHRHHNLDEDEDDSHCYEEFELTQDVGDTVRTSQDTRSVTSVVRSAKKNSFLSAEFLKKSEREKARVQKLAKKKIRHGNIGKSIIVKIKDPFGSGRQSTANKSKYMFGAHAPPKTSGSHNGIAHTTSHDHENVPTNMKVEDKPNGKKRSCSKGISSEKIIVRISRRRRKRRKTDSKVKTDVDFEMFKEEDFVFL